MASAGAELVAGAAEAVARGGKPSAGGAGAAVGNCANRANGRSVIPAIRKSLDITV